MTTMLAPRAAEAPLERVGHDVYRDVHKGLRAGLFALTADLGRVDPVDGAALTTLHQRQRTLFELLDAHALHEDLVVGPVLAQLAPGLDAAVRAEHAGLDRSMDELRSLAATAEAVSGSDRAVAVRRWYLASASFTSAYLAHQGTEELAVAPLLADHLGTAGVVDLERRIVAQITPDHFDGYLRLILPAANRTERAQLLQGMRDGAPPEVLAAALALARDVLPTEEHDRLLADLG